MWPVAAFRITSASLPVVDLGISPDSALAWLRADHIRYVIVDGQRKAVATALPRGH